MSLAPAGESLGDADLAVASAGSAGDAAATGAGMVVVEGARRPSLGSQALATRAFLALPSVEEPTFFLPLDCRAALRYALTESLAPPVRWKRLRNRLLEPALARGIAPASRLLTVAQREHGEPFLARRRARPRHPANGSSGSSPPARATRSRGACSRSSSATRRSRAGR